MSTPLVNSFTTRLQRILKFTFVTIGGFCFSPVSLSNEYAETLFRAVVENSLALRRFDVRMTYFESRIPTDKHFIELVGDEELNESSRLIVDRDSERGLLIREHTRTLLRGAHRETSLSRRFDTFNDGNLRSRAKENQVGTKLLPRKGVFLDFLKLGVCPSGLPLAIHLETDDGIATILEKRVTSARERGTTRVLPDGTVSVQIPTKNDNGVVTSVYFDKNNYMPSRYIVSREIDGKKGVLSKQSVEYEQINGLYLPVFVSHDDGYDRNYRDVEKTLKCDTIWTLQLHWNQVNPELLSFPDEDRLAHEWPQSASSFIESDERFIDGNEAKKTP